MSFHTSIISVYYFSSQQLLSPIIMLNRRCFMSPESPLSPVIVFYWSIQGVKQSVSSMIMWWQKERVHSQDRWNHVWTHVTLWEKPGSYTYKQTDALCWCYCPTFQFFLADLLGKECCRTAGPLFPWVSILQSWKPQCGFARQEEEEESGVQRWNKEGKSVLWKWTKSEG